MRRTDGQTSSQKVLRAKSEPPSERSFAHASNALTFVSKSLPAVANFALRLRERCVRIGIILFVNHSYAVASSRLSIGFRKSDLDERQAAAVRVGSKQRNIAPKIIIYQTSHRRIEFADT